MSAFSRRWLFSDVGLLVMGLIAVVVVAILLPNGKTTTRRRSTNVQSHYQSGTLALRLWLEEMGYRTKVLSTNRVDPGGCDVIFVLDPDYPYEVEDARTVSEWVAEGHTLIVAGGSGAATNSLLTPYGVSVDNWQRDVSKLLHTSPTLSNPPFYYADAGGSSFTINTPRTDVAMHLVSEAGEPVLASFPYGSGLVWLMGTEYPFTNQGIQFEYNARLILNLLAHVDYGATIGFEEALRLPGEQSQQPSGLTDWFITSHAGQSILAAVGLVMVFLLMRGRRFGQPVPLTQEHLRREPVEFIVAMAHLMRRSGHRAEALRYYRSEVQRVLAHRYGVDPHLPADELVRVVALHDPTVDTAALANLLQQLSRKSVNEQELVRLALEVYDWIGDRD
jgi:hypothetical protein